MLLSGSIQAVAQVTDSTAVQRDSLATDSLSVPIPDTLNVPQQGQRPPAPAQGGGAGPQRGNLKEGEVRFQATDSLVFDFREERVADLYGSAKVNHTAGQLESGRVTLNLDENIVRAQTQTPQDTLSQPVLTRDGEPPVRSNRIAFNYKTEKGRFDVARVEISEGKLTGTKVKNAGPHVIFLEDAIYSTCTLDHPHYYIKMDQAKLVRENGNEEVFFKNARLYILDIPYPIIFPFGYFPGNMSRRQSGLLEATYVFQQTNERGLGLRNLGWFQYFNDYITGQASVDIYTSGSFFLDTQARYSNRNKYSGSVRIGYSRQRGLEPTDPNFTTRTDRNISIQHNQQFSPFAKMSANINLRTGSYYRNNSYDTNERAQTTSTSHLNYNYRHPEGLYTFSSSINQTNNFLTNVVNMNGPSFDFSLKRFAPFDNNATSGDEEPWYESFTLTYGNSFQSEFRYNPINGEDADINWLDALLNPSKYREATGNTDHYQYGLRQNVTMSVNNLLNNPFLNLSANTNFTEFWFPATTRRVFNPDSNRTESRQIRGFSSAREFTSSLNFSTTFYGISNTKISNIEGFRHTVRPNISLSYRPDFSSDFFGYYRTVQTNEEGDTQEYSIFENQVFQGPGSGEQRNINFSLNSIFEAKQVRRDSTGEKNERILRLVDQFNLSSSYNFAADSLNLSNLNASLTSSVVSGLNLRATANYSFYKQTENGRRINEFIISDGKRLAELTNFRFTAGTSFSGGKGGVRLEEHYHFPAQYDPYNQGIFNEMDPYFNTQPVQNLTSPWSVSINFNYNWSLNGQTSATINAQNIQFQLTPKWSFGTQLGYDFIDQELTPSEFRLQRQLHEWNLSFRMRPFGDFQFYSFSLRLNSSQLQGIFQKLPLLRNLERSSSPTGRGFGGPGRF